MASVRSAAAVNQSSRGPSLTRSTSSAGGPGSGSASDARAGGPAGGAQRQHRAVRAGARGRGPTAGPSSGCRAPAPRPTPPRTPHSRAPRGPRRPRRAPPRRAPVPARPRRTGRPSTGDRARARRVTATVTGATRPYRTAVDRRLQDGRARRIADQPVDQRSAGRVERPGARHPEVRVPGPAQVLHGGQRPGPYDGDAPGPVIESASIGHAGSGPGCPGASSAAGSRARVPQHRVRRPDQLPAAGRRARVHPGVRARERRPSRPGRPYGAWPGAARAYRAGSPVR